MNELKKILSAAAAIAMLSGCGHSITTYSKGVGFEATWRSDSILPSIRIGSYENVDLAQKENSHVKYRSGIGADGGIVKSENGNNAEFKSGTTLEVKTGPVTTGYVRDVLCNPEIKKEHVEIVKQLSAVDSSISDKNKNILSPEIKKENPNESKPVKIKKTENKKESEKIKINENTKKNCSVLLKLKKLITGFFSFIISAVLKIFS